MPSFLLITFIMPKIKIMMLTPLPCLDDLANTDT